MVAIRARKIRHQTYYYLIHSSRKEGIVMKQERYLGKDLPDDIEEKKEAFLRELESEQYEKLDKIQRRYAKEARALPVSAKEKARQQFAIRFTYDTQRIEGSTLTRKETADLLEHGLTPAQRPLRDVKEAEAHERLFTEAMDEELTLDTILSWHKRLFGETKPDIAGRLRTHQVLIARSKFTPPLGVEVAHLVREFFAQYKKTRGEHPVALAARVHLRFVTIHPFADGNGRISRLMMNAVLHQHGYPMLSIPYEKRASYYNALERSQVKKDETIFVRWLIKKYLGEYRKYARGS